MQKKTKNIEKKENRIKVSIDTPCTVSELESLLHMISQSGHWHDAEIRDEDGSIVVEFEIDEEN